MFYVFEKETFCRVQLRFPTVIEKSRVYKLLLTKRYEKEISAPCL